MNEHHILDLLDNVIEGTLKPEQRQFIELHITQCPECKSEFDRLNAFMSKIDALPKEIQPPRDLWSGIEKRITTQPRGTIIELPGHQYEGSVEQQKAMRREIQQGIVRRSVWYFRAAAVALLFIISAALYWYLTLPELPSWQVTTLEGKPKIGSELLAATGKLYIGDLLETDNASRAKLTVGKIGEVELEPNTKLRLL
ncbi:MAG: zf-HC2 domain-containing protein, partial [Bacteroidetes bacterium]